MIDIVFNIIGIAGAILMPLAYFMLQRDIVKSTDMSYLLTNILASILLIISLLHNWNLSVFVIEVIWLFISFYGIARVMIISSRISASERKE